VPRLHRPVRHSGSDEGVTPSTISAFWLWTASNSRGRQRFRRLATLALGVRPLAKFTLPK